MTSWEYPDGWSSWTTIMKEDYINLGKAVIPTFHDTGTHFED